MAMLVRQLREITGKLDGRAEAVLADDGSTDSGYRHLASTAGLDGAPGQAVTADGFRRLVAPGQRRPLLPRQLWRARRISLLRARASPLPCRGSPAQDRSPCAPGSPGRLSRGC